MKFFYEDFNDLDKIDCLKLLDEDGQSGENENEKNRICYTCRFKKCKIPCQCAPCCTSNGQCKEYKIQHVDLFDEVKHAVIVRSTEDFCRDQSFFAVSYINKYSGIPIDCIRCEKDLLHHKIYHISHHDDCKFSVQNWYKLG